MKQSDIIERLFGLLDKAIESHGLANRVAELERKLAEMEAVWPQIKENDNGAS